MEKSWTIKGVYANWTLTLNISPPEDDPTPIVEWPERADRVERYFQDIVNSHENALEVERLLHTPGVVSAFLRSSEPDRAG